VSAIWVYTTTGSPEEAQRLGGLLLESRLAACVNIIEGMTSMFWWEGKVNQARETIMVAKTKDSLLRELTEKIVSSHEYDCPCIVALPIIGGHDDFIQWIHSETR
jgi:periplasmic divalent cation tolerance protein